VAAKNEAALNAGVIIETSPGAPSLWNVELLPIMRLTTNIHPRQ
jgi:hypothetical protein